MNIHPEGPVSTRPTASARLRDALAALLAWFRPRPLPVPARRRDAGPVAVAPTRLYAPLYAPLCEHRDAATAAQCPRFVDAVTLLDELLAPWAASTYLTHEDDVVMHAPFQPADRVVRWRTRRALLGGSTAAAFVDELLAGGGR